MMPCPTVRNRLRGLVVAWGLAGLLVAAPLWGAPADALRILQKAGQSGLAQNFGLAADKKAQVEQILQSTAQRTGGKAYAILLKRDENPKEYGELYTSLGMQGRDLLIASNGTAWEVRVAALSHDAKQMAVDKALKVEGLEPIERLRALTGELTTALSQTGARTGKLSWNEFQAAHAGKGWSGSRMSAEYARYKEGGQIAVVGAPTPVTRSEGSNAGWYVVGAVLLAVVGWVLWRRRQRDANLASELKAALQAPEGVLTDIYMNIDGLENHPQFGQLLEAANACQAKLDTLKQGQPSREAIAKARALNDEANRVRRQFDEARMVR